MDRYSSPLMAALWSDDAKYERWRRVEVAVLEARLAVSAPSFDPTFVLTTELVRRIASVPAPAPEEVRAAEQTTRHDVVAFLMAWTADMDPQDANFVHQGLTSSDIVDTGMSIVLRDVSEELDMKATRLLSVLDQHGRKHARTLRLARTHGQPAGPDTWGHRVADLAFAIARTRDRLRSSSGGVAMAKISGPVGSYTGVSRAVEVHVANELGLGVPSSSTQVLSRDSLAAWGSDCVALASVCEALATEIRLGAAFEVGELQEGVGVDQVGSSAIPGKRNPISSEKITGLARVLRGTVTPLLEDISLWQHRDISQSSVERVELPLISSLTDHVLETSIGLVEGLVVHEKRMMANLEFAALFAAGPAVLDYLTERGLPRMKAARAIATAREEASRSNLPPRERDRVFLATVSSMTGMSLPFEVPLDFAIGKILQNDDLAGVFDRLGEVAGS